MGRQKNKIPSTPALRALKAAKIPFEVFTYDYVERGGTRASSEALGVPERQIVKTLVMEDERGAPLLMLQHGDVHVSTKALARALGVKRITPCTPQVATKHTGYKVGGTSPFGTRKRLPLYAEATLAELPELWINGGGRGLLVRLTGADLSATLSPTWVQASTS